MALEVQVFREITDYQPKVLAGLTWRQVGIVLGAGPILVGVYMACYWAGFEDVGVVAVSLGAIPAVALGWVRPMGVAFENYVGYWWAHQHNRSPLIYAEAQGNETKKNSSQARRSVRKTAAFEATN